MFKKDPLLLVLILISLLLFIYNPSFIKEVPRFIEYNTIIILFTFMLITKGIEFSGYLNLIADFFIERVHSERGLAFSLIIIELAIGPIVTNDISLFLMIPITLAIARRIKFDIEKLIIFEIWAANIGSSFFPIGNPQNIYIYQASRMGFFEFIWKMVPFEIINIFLLFIIIYLSFGKEKVKIKTLVPIVKDKKLLILSLLLLFLSIFFIDYKHPIFAMITTLIAYLIFNMKIIYYGINLNLLLIFIFLFIIIGGIREVEVINRLFLSIKDVFLPSVILSQFISNVPTAIILSPYTVSYIHLLYGVNVAGNGTIISSLANLIGIRLGGISIKRFHLYSLLFLGITTILIYTYLKVF